MANHTTEIWAGSMVPTAQYGYNGALEAPQPGEVFEIAGNEDGGQRLAVKCQDNAAGVYEVTRSGPGVVIPEAKEWDLQDGQVILKQGGAVTGLLLGPSLLGSHLYGASAEPEKGTERFGSISLVYDNVDKAHLVNVSMPERPYRGMGRVVILKVNART